MPHLTSEQRNRLYLQQASRAGIHQPILAALYTAHQSPNLSDEEQGLGITHEDCNTFEQQVLYAANVIRVLGDRLIAQSWQGSDLWFPAAGCYSDRFLELIADGFTPAVEDTQVGILKPCAYAALKAAYTEAIEQNWLPEDLSRFDEQLLQLVEQLPEFYVGLVHQRQACLEAVRIWRGLDTVELAIESLAQETKKSLRQLAREDLDITLKQFVQRSGVKYQGYPYQRESFIRLVQLWRQLPSREATLLNILNDPQPHANLEQLDAVLLQFVQTLPTQYTGKGTQRNALTEAFRVWRQLDSRQTAVFDLGIDATLLQSENPDPATLQSVAQQLDQELLNFIERVPQLYTETHQQREALIRMVQLWRELPTREQTIHSLVADHKKLEQTVTPMQFVVVPPRGRDRWILENLELTAPILPDGQFIWAQATQCGTCLPPNQQTIEAIVQFTQLLERAAKQLGVPFLVNRWYQPITMNRAWQGTTEQQHNLGTALEFICPGLTANQVYWTLDPWWPGGLGRYAQYPMLCHVDARPYRARWRQD